MKRSREHISESEDEGLDYDETEGDLSQLKVKDELDARAKNQLKDEAEVGVIDRITLINFMCHKRLDVHLNPNTNFILGRNGSGKSAIMTGIVVGLGGNARSTERGKSLKQFIHTGERSAEVRVTLRNRGKDAYRHEVYGDFICVERVINSEGAGSYKIKNHSGKTISTKKEELTSILDNCGIQVDNPVSLLNQDTSRHFLQKSKPADKYKLFMKATHLEQIASDYEKAEQDQEIMKEAIGRQKGLLPEYEAEAKQLEEKVESFKRFTDMQDRVDRLKKELQWAMVTELEKAITPIEKDIRKEKNRIPRNEKKMSDAEEDVVRWETQESRAQEELDGVVTEASALTTERDALSGEKRKIERSIRELNGKFKSLVGQIKEKEKEKSLLETTRNNCIAMSQRDRSGEKELREKQLQDFQKKLEKLEGEISVAENDRKQFDMAAKKGKDKLSELQRRVSAEGDALKKCEEQLERLRSSHNNRLAMFGRNMQELVDTIQRNRRQFSHLPVGPLGSEIKLRDYTWATAVEQVLKKSLLHSFVVDNHGDAAKLRKMLQGIYRQGYKPDIIVSRFQSNVYDVRRNRPEVDCMTVLDILDVRDPNVLNVLIDQCHVESILLIANRNEASRVIVHDRPRNAMCAYTREGDQVLQYGHYSNKFGKLGILRESVEAAVRDEEARLAELRQAQGELRGEMNDFETKMRRDEGRVREVATRVTRKMVEKRKVNAAIEELRNAQEEEEPEEDIATYDSEIAELEEVITGLREEHQKLNSEKQKLDSDHLACFQKHSSIDKEVEQVSMKVNKLKVDMEDSAHKKREATQMVKYYRDRIDTIQATISELETKVSEQKERVVVATRKAEEACARVATERSRQTIKSEIDKLQRYIEREMPQQAEKERIEAEYEKAMDRYLNTRQMIKDEQHALKVLRRGLECRKDKYVGLQERITFRTQVYFGHFLQQRDYVGGIRFNHQTQRLEIEVNVDRHTNQSSTTKNTKALSGGERSFTTVCFIMSLWEAMEAPFRCLDEFDVFMDMMNRRISMRLMMEHAQDQPHRQFIFFTPQDMSSMGIKMDCSRVKVIKLNPPERGQDTLRFREN